MFKRAKERALWGSEDTGRETFATTFTSSSAKDDDFIALQDDDLKEQFSELVFAQPKTSPGEDDSLLPGIGKFQVPTGALAQVFKTVYFNTDEYSPKDADSKATIQKVAAYLKANPSTFIFVTGNCDQRGPEGYNQALGLRRCNSIRSMLIREGANPEQIHTISYGKEKPADPRNNAEAWAKNRRAEFKIFVKK